ncbi:unnamed protein product [Ectocarpus sp. CCAP 1310/34]|nr:unnamed protein product [Ectocarpus sp. CCAP 1310/34]
MARIAPCKQTAAAISVVSVLVHYYFFHVPSRSRDVFCCIHVQRLVSWQNAPPLN